MDYGIIQVVACIVLGIAAIRQIRKASPSPNIYRNLLPFIIVAGLSSLVLGGLQAMEWFVAWYSGAIYETDTGSVLKPPSGLLQSVIFLLQLLPWIAVIPAIGKRPVLTAVIAFSASLPFLHGYLVG